VESNADHRGKFPVSIGIIYMLVEAGNGSCVSFPHLFDN
jgi:hypothetical protein